MLSVFPFFLHFELCLLFSFVGFCVLLPPSHRNTNTLHIVYNYNIGLLFRRAFKGCKLAPSDLFCGVEEKSCTLFSSCHLVVDHKLSWSAIRMCFSFSLGLSGSCRLSVLSLACVCLFVSVSVSVSYPF